MMAEQMTLGALINALKSADPDEFVRYDFGNFRITKPDSYRGYYEQLAFGFVEHHDLSALDTVGDLLVACKNACGETFQGYKGGSYMMDHDTPIWAANRGQSTGTAITGLREMAFGYVVETAAHE